MGAEVEAAGSRAEASAGHFEVCEDTRKDLSDEGIGQLQACPSSSFGVPPPVPALPPWRLRALFSQISTRSFPKAQDSNGTPGRARRYEREAQAILTRGMVTIGDL